MKFHLLADLFPLLDGADFDDLVEDIRVRGLREKILTFEDKILDGRNRFRACKAAKVEPAFREYKGKDPLGEVLSLNIHRRHLDESQRAMVAAKIAALPKGSNQHAQACAPSQADAAEKLNVGRRTVQQARVVLEKAVPELARAVEQGKVSVSAASDIAAHATKAQQRKAAEDPAAARSIAKDIRTEKAAERPSTKLCEVCGLTTRLCPGHKRAAPKEEARPEVPRRTRLACIRNAWAQLATADQTAFLAELGGTHPDKLEELKAQRVKMTAYENARAAICRPGQSDGQRMMALVLDGGEAAMARLGLDWNSSADDLKQAWKRASLDAHPDRGGSHERQSQVNQDHALLVRWFDKESPL